MRLAAIRVPYPVVVTNQGGIGLGYMKESQLHKIHDHMTERLREEGAIIHDVAYLPTQTKSRV